MERGPRRARGGDDARPTGEAGNGHIGVSVPVD